MSNYTQLIRERIIRSPNKPLPGGGVGRQRCPGYQFPCSPDAYPHADVGPVVCPYTILVSQAVLWNPNGIDLSGITQTANCPSGEEGSLITATTEIDLGRL